MKIDWNGIPEVAGARPGASRRGICGNLISALQVHNAAGTQFDGKLHWHDNEQILIVTEGSCRIVIDGQETEAHPGDLVFFPSRSRHAVISCGPEGCVYYELFAPARPDQLPGWVGQSALRYD
jgi:mannose-6-phosphate isomerase-like protein (cupin superfamily)